MSSVDPLVPVHVLSRESGLQDNEDPAGQSAGDRGACVMAADVDRLIVRIYEAGVSGEGWDQVASAVCEAVQGEALWAQVRGGNGVPQAPFLLHGISQRAIDDYAAHYWRLNPVTGPMMTSPLDEIRNLDVIAGAGVLQRTELFHDWAVPNGLVRSLGWRGLAGDGDVLAVTVARASGVDWSPQELRLLRRLAPHFSHATRVGRGIRAARDEARALRSLLDSLRCAAFLLDGEGRITAANAPAIGLLRAGDLLRDDSRHLRAAHPSADARLRASVAAWSDGDVGRPVYLGPVGRSTPLAFVLPRVGADGGRDAGAVVLVPPVDAAVSALADWLVDTYDLTPAEADVALQVSSGADLRDIAGERATSIGTVRNQVKRAMDKLGVRRRQELVAMLAAAAGPVEVGLGRNPTVRVPPGT